MLFGTPTFNFIAIFSLDYGSGLRNAGLCRLYLLAGVLRGSTDGKWHYTNPVQRAMPGAETAPTDKEKTFL
jgi:hypothetical protein